MWCNRMPAKGSSFKVTIPFKVASYLAGGHLKTKIKIKYKHWDTIREKKGWISQSNKWKCYEWRPLKYLAKNGRV